MLIHVAGSGPEVIRRLGIPPDHLLFHKLAHRGPIWT